MSNKFHCESHIYKLLEKAGLNVPKYFTVTSESDVEKITFAEGTPVVIKGCAQDLWHKSDIGCVQFKDFKKSEVMAIDSQMKKSVKGQHEWIETLVIERVQIQTVNELPSSAFVSMQNDLCCGPVINFGVGGIHTEEWANKLESSLHIWPTTVCGPEEAFLELKTSWPGQVWLGLVRQGEAIVSDAEVLKFLKSLWKLSELLKNEDIGLLEVNPFVISKEGKIVALDGVGQSMEEQEEEMPDASFDPQSLLNPKSIAIAGVSSKSHSVGRMILENILKSRIPIQQIGIIKPNAKELLGVTCIPDCSKLKENPVDILIISLPAKKTIDLFIELFAQNGGASVVYIVAGGLGDGADKHGYGDQLKAMIRERRDQGLWTPAVVGPNGLGMIQSALNLNTLFIPQEKLNIVFNERSHMALVSQSGAFLITRLSRQSGLSLKYGFSIGNQLDLGLADFMKCMREDEDIKVLGLYIEGLGVGDGCAISKEIIEYRKLGKQVVIYKGGRSEEGAKAAAGHTGAMSGDYDLQKKLLSKAGGVVVETFNQFNSVFKWMGAYPRLRKMENIAVVTNAGYETVGSVDILCSRAGVNLFKFSDKQSLELAEILKKDGLGELVSATNPLDITPMANEENYLNCIKYICQQDVDIILVGLVPLTKNLETSRCERSVRFAAKLKEISEELGKSIGIIIDAGVPYLEYRDIFEVLNLPVFESMDQAVLGVNIISRNRTSDQR